MIQRIQSIYLFIVAAMSSLYFVLPFCGYTLPEAHYLFNITGIVDASVSIEKTPIPSNTLPLIIIVALIVMISIFTIFSFKKRGLQIKLGRFNLLLNAFFVVLVFFDADQLGAALKAKPEYGLGMLVPVIAMLFIFLANRAIRKDDELVKSTDRLR